MPVEQHIHLFIFGRPWSLIFMRFTSIMLGYTHHIEHCYITSQMKAYDFAEILGNWCWTRNFCSRSWNGLWHLFFSDFLLISSTWNSANRPFQGKHPKRNVIPPPPTQKGGEAKKMHISTSYSYPLFPHKASHQWPFSLHCIRWHFRYWSFCRSRLLVRGHGTQPVSSLETNVLVGRVMSPGNRWLFWVLNLPLSLNWAVLMAMSKWAIHITMVFLWNDEQMSNQVGVEHQPVTKNSDKKIIKVIS